MSGGERRRLRAPRTALSLVIACLLLPGLARSSTYVVYIPLDSSIYPELDTLNSLGLLLDYLEEVRPISRIEAARLTLEAERRLEQKPRDFAARDLAQSVIGTLREQVGKEIGWIEDDREDNPPDVVVQPVQRLEAQYIYSQGDRRQLTWPGGQMNATEGTPLLPNNDGLPTSPGSNEAVRLQSWAGSGSFLTTYGEGAIAGPLGGGVSGPPGTYPSRFNFISGEAVVSLGNLAVSFGNEETSLGTGYFGSLSESNNAPAFTALRVRRIRPHHLPGIFRYLGPLSAEAFFGQLDAVRPTDQHPWVFGHIIAVKPLPDFEIGMTRAIVFGGRGNDHYNLGGFLGRASGIATGNPANGNTHSRAGVFLKFYFPWLRNAEVYQETLGVDNLTKEVPTLGHYMPFLNVSYQGGFYLPRLTADGLTDFRFEYAIMSPGYSIRTIDSLYWTYDNQWMGDPLGPNASEVDAQIGRWFGLRRKAAVDVFYTEQAPFIYEGNDHIDLSAVPASYQNLPGNEHSVGMAISMFSLPAPAAAVSQRLAMIPGLAGGRVKFAVEYVRGFNYSPGSNSVRLMLMLSGSLENVPGWEWR